MPCQSGCLRVQGEILLHYGRAVYNAGCWNPSSVLDDGYTPSAHARGEAIDIGVSVAYRGRNSTGQTIFAHLVSQAGRLGIVQLIWDAQIWTASRPTIRPYTANPHRDHIHCQFTPSAARDSSLSAKPFPGTTAPPTEEMPDMPVFLFRDGRDGAIHLKDTAKVGTIKVPNTTALAELQVVLAQAGADGITTVHNLSGATCEALIRG